MTEEFKKPQTSFPLQDEIIGSIMEAALISSLVYRDLMIVSLQRACKTMMGEGNIIYCFFENSFKLCFETSPELAP
jgi:hypothetical protein